MGAEDFAAHYGFNLSSNCVMLKKSTHFILREGIKELAYSSTQE
jgi:hypothetical protein